MFVEALATALAFDVFRFPAFARVASAAAATATDADVMQSWALSALTDRALADATQFLAGR